MISISTRKYEGQSGAQINLCGHKDGRIEISDGRISIWGKDCSLIDFWTPDTKFYVEATA